MWISITFCIDTDNHSNVPLSLHILTEHLCRISAGIRVLLFNTKHIVGYIFYFFNSAELKV